ncbi:MAG: hypothetical protein P8J55_09615 [Pseudomonadales bacterium]|nr:hypothetical protein [Pseudomonadales bacterium]
MDGTIEKYLTRYAELEVTVLPAFTFQSHEHCLVVPAFQESYEDLTNVWQQLPVSTLIILVINAPHKDPKTLALAARIHTSYQRTQHSANLSLLQAENLNDILLVDRYAVHRLIPTHQGVGLARKIGADLALALIATGVVSEAKISSTDADTALPESYFSRVMAPGEAALIYPFTHQASEALTQASLLYEVSMLYYAAGLKWSGSRYGFPSIGSIITISPLHYAQVRGFPKRNAGEDFYLLNKLAKVGAITCLEAPRLTIEARLSDRVPFGTGPGLRKIMALDNPIEEYGFYNPQIFVHLQQFLAGFHKLWTATDPAVIYTDSVADFCEAQGFGSLVKKGKDDIKSETVFLKFLEDWFDGFRTLKFVHHLRQYYPSVSFEEIHRAPFVHNLLSLPDTREMLASQCFNGPKKTKISH